ncbi:NAD(P)-dependent oxidoreductase [Alloscardovia theropitheci]|uniref:NAD(P)-dependent oxidoreductase n=1 Tax=Alloscardovia theropitheci TaxID=2496842 RepID=A0A4R0QSN8_9BIFI|nr:NAD(P)-dependent oxidoreductase [Alloscardovia theropitheci]TCD54165.1 NAD(P)-dependent oxidoreductase [Alloscardovia theropitheci]
MANQHNQNQSKVFGTDGTHSMWTADAKLAASHVVNPHFFDNKTVAVLGASGFIGSVTAYALQELGARVVACGRNTNRLRLLFGGVPGIVIKALNLQEPLDFSQDNDALIDYERVDIIIDAASPADPASFANEPVQTMLTNISGVDNVLNYARDHAVEQVLYISSGEVYGYFTHDHPVKETEQGFLNILASRSCYPQSKRAAETLCASYVEQYGLDVRIARPSHILGPEFSTSDSRASAQFFRDTLAGHSITLMSTGEQIRTFAYISDCVSGLLSILSVGEKGNAYNVTNSDSPTSFADFARYVGDVGNVQVTIPVARSGASDNSPSLRRVAQLDNTKLRSLGWSPQFNAREAVERTYTLLSLIR